MLRETLPPPPPPPPAPPRHPDDEEQEPWYYQLERELEHWVQQGLPPPPPSIPGLHGLSWVWTACVWSPKRPAEPQEAVWEGGPEEEDEEQQQQ